MTTCIGCGCTDDEACEGGCSWIAKNPSELAGLCSACGLGAVGAVTLDDAEFECEQVELDWIAEQPAIGAEYADTDRKGCLILPEDPDFFATLRGGRC